MHLLLALAFLSLGLNAAPVDSDALSHYSVENLKKAELDRLATQFEIVARQGKRYELLVPPRRKAELLAIAPKAKLLELDIHETLRKMPADWGAEYHTFETVKTDLEAFVKSYPKLAKLSTYGKSEDGRALYALKISDNVDKEEGEPEVMLTAATHGNEIVTVEVIFGLMEALLKNYSKDTRLTSLVDGLQIYFLPVVNPDGYSNRTRYANGLDPNRDFPQRGKPAKKSNASVQSLVDFFSAHKFAGSIDFHTHGEMIMFPWAATEDEVPSADWDIFDQLTARMAKTNGYESGQVSHVLYTAVGSSLDYFYNTGKTLALGIEVGTSHTPSPSSIPNAVRSQSESTWVFLDHFLP